MVKKITSALFMALVASAILPSAAEMGQSCIDPTTAYRTNSVPCSIMGSGLGTVLLDRNPLSRVMEVAFESRFRASTASVPTAYDPAWVPGFQLIVR